MGSDHTAVTDRAAGLDWLRGGDERVALCDPDSSIRLSYATLRERVQAVAEQLVGLGVEPGDVIGYSLANGPASVIAFLATVAAGAAAAPLNPAYSNSEVSRYLSDLAPRLVLIDSSNADAVIDAAKANEVAIQRFIGTGDDLRLDTTTRARPLPAADEGATALLLHTSGTTGRAKVVPLRGRNLTASAAAIAHHYQLTATDVSHCVMPLFHVHGLVASTLATFYSGGSVLAPRRFSASRFWAQGATEGATWFSAVPTIHQILIDGSDSRLTPRHELRFARSCSAALAPTVMEAFEQIFQLPLIEAYGMTEAAHQMTSNPVPPGVRQPGSVGLPAGAEVRIVDDDWEPLPPNTDGEVAVRGDGVIDGYLDNLVANNVSFRSGWFRTGDSGALDSKGYLHLHGRIKELINRAGEKISPHEVEAVLLAHPAVAEAVVFATPDRKYGETVAAAVVLKASSDEQTLTAHTAQHLADFKVPTSIAILDGIPKGPTGKIQRRLLPALLDKQ